MSCHGWGDNVVPTIRKDASSPPPPTTRRMIKQVNRLGLTIRLEPIGTT
jgi:hypothetical protein